MTELTRVLVGAGVWLVLDIYAFIYVLIVRKGRIGIRKAVRVECVNGIIGTTLSIVLLLVMRG